ncbi:N-acetylmuramoyl-L-alanine amidase [Streptomyces sp. NBC_01498]|nr:peptidoglycan recognition family protein [Streptomyces sp. NBC_01498]WTL23879.1 N-acetylmuramoyl-L-alanine amidase [Streptomyces sp. NBC_01498]
MTGWRRGRAVLLGTVVAASLALTGQPATAAPYPGGEAAPDAAPAAMNTAFAKAAAAYDVPRDLLVAVGYGETHLDGHGGRPSQANGYGVMHLVSQPEHKTLERAAKLTGVPVATLKKDTVANIRGAAAVLRAEADTQGLDATGRDSLAAWYPVAAAYGAAADDRTARLYADAAYDLLNKGLRAQVAGNEQVLVKARKVTPDRGKYAKIASDFGVLSDDYPAALWVPASTSNYQAGRTSAINKVVIHVTQGSYAGSISWFQNPASQVSAHYVIRSSDGQVTQTVRDANTAWHARSANASSIGIEHEGYVADPSWFTDSMYRSSAALTRHLTSKYGIPRTRAAIVGHSEVPGNDHTDPGANWNWTYYMSLVNGGGGNPDPGGTSFPTWGTGVSIRKEATTTSAQVASLAGPTTVKVQCQKRGQLVNYQGYSNDAWSYLPAYGGYISNIFIDVSEPWLPGVPNC